MSSDEPPGGHELTPEEVGARVTAILAAAERDARAVIAASHRPAPAPRAPEPRPAETLAELATALELLAARVEALERTIGSDAAREHAASPAPAREVHEAPVSEPAARVRAIDMALAGYSREAISRELELLLAPAEVDRLLDEVLAG